MLKSSIKNILIRSIGHYSLVNGMKSKITATGRERQTAGLIVIGDEILKGITHDTNSHFISKRLHNLGVIVKKISVVGDAIKDISDEVRLFSSQYDIVFTTGGVGPTHDDNTFTGLADAFNDEMHLSEEIVAAVQSFLPSKKSPRSSPTNNHSNHPSPLRDNTRKRNDSFISKLATIPRSSTLLWGIRDGKRSPFPVVKINNVIAFPGVPQFCERAFIDLESQLFSLSEVEHRFSVLLYSSKSEFSFSHLLSSVAQMFSDTVDIGSYPIVDNTYYATKLTIESESIDEGEKAVMELKKVLKDHLVVYDSSPSVSTVEKYEAYRERVGEEKDGDEFIDRLDSAMEVITKIIDEYKLEEISLSFNGGKDCTVLLHLLRIAIDKRYGPQTRLSGFHIMVEDQFPEMSQFVLDVSASYNIDVIEYSGPLKEGLEALKKDKPQTVAVLMGSRSTDPKGRYMKSTVEWTDSDWPRVLRVCPILNWSYSDVWRFLRGLCVPYCKLYDQGYTSLGGRLTTKPNESLRIIDERTHKERYLPAYRLEDDALERNGRYHIYD